MNRLAEVLAQAAHLLAEHETPFALVGGLSVSPNRPRYPPCT